MNTPCVCCKSCSGHEGTNDVEVIRCAMCGMPHWKENGESTVSPKWVRFAITYWSEFKMRVFPADYAKPYVSTYGTIKYETADVELIKPWNREIGRKGILCG